MIDNCFGGKQATQHLLEQGYHTIGIITGDLDEWSARQRLRGWQESLAAAGLFADPCLIFEGDWSAASGARGLHQLLAQRPEIDAIFASNDQMALGVLSMAHELRRQIPQELGVVGFVLYTSLFAVAALMLWRTGRCSATEWPALEARFLLGSIVGYLVAGCFITRHDQALPYILLGISSALIT